MRFSYYGNRTRAFLHGTALILLGSLATGCSSEVVRFSDYELVTGATSNQREIIGDSASQPFPGDGGVTPAYSVSNATQQPTDLRGGSVSRSALAPVAATASQTGSGVTALAPVSAPALTHPARTAAAAPVSPSGGNGWSSAGGTEVTLRPGETIYNLSRRFGVPVQEILKANSIADGANVQAGSTILVPTYAYSKQAPVSAPDNHPKVASASAGATQEPVRQTPSTLPEPTREAVLPDTPKTRESMAGAATSASSESSGKAASASAYTVVSGDTLHAIARRHGVTTNDLKQANGLTSGTIRIGQVLKLPGASTGKTHAVAAATPAAAKKTAAATDNLPQYTPPVRKTDEIITEAKADVPDATGVGKMRWPARGRVITEFGKTVAGRRNDGVDIAVPAGTSVKAAENGVVIYAGDSLKDFGNTVLLRHENGLVTVYGHAEKLKVSRGDIVRRGDEIAVSGMTGAAEMPKLHFEVRDNSVPVDPMTYLQ